MQIKMIIGTIAFMLTMILLGFYSLLEESRMAHFTEARLGRQIEKGAELFSDNCATCHGINGRGTNGGECYDAAGEQIACKGLPLNDRNLLCGDPSRRMQARDWKGATKLGFIHDTINSGRAGGVMVPWGQIYGGPLQENSIDNLTLFVLNWETEEMCAFVPVVFPWPDPAEDPDAAWAAVPDVTEEDVREANPDLGADPLPFELPIYPGDADNGRDLYLNTYACNACHGDPEVADSQVNAPWHGDLATNAATRVSGVSAEGYIYQSILIPDAFIVDGFENLMQSYAEQMGESPQDLMDIMTYLMSLDG